MSLSMSTSTHTHSKPCISRTLAIYTVDRLGGVSLESVHSVLENQTKTILNFFSPAAFLFSAIHGQEISSPGNFSESSFCLLSIPERKLFLTGLLLSDVSTGDTVTSVILCSPAKDNMSSRKEKLYWFRTTVIDTFCLSSFRFSMPACAWLKLFSVPVMLSCRSSLCPCIWISKIFAPHLINFSQKPR